MLEIFKMLVSNNKIELPKPKGPEEVGRTDDPKYCHYHRIINHPIKDFFLLKDKLQALVDADVLHLNKEKKKVIIKMT